MTTHSWRLFIDDHWVARATGFDRVVHHPRPMGVVIPADKPWETAGVGLNYVERRDDGQFVAFYNAMWWDLERGATMPVSRVTQGNDRAHHIYHRIGYATSEDGVHWDKPTLGLTDAPADVDRQTHAPFPTPVGSSRDNNLGVPFVVAFNLGRYGNVADSTKRYALRLAPDHSGGSSIGSSHFHAPRGYFASDLPDFLHDPAWRDKLVDAGSNFNPRRNQVHFWDDLHQEWVALEQGVTPHWIPSREVGRFASPDLVHWTSHSVLYPDAADSHTPQRYDEPMSMTPFYAEGAVFGLLSWFHSDRSHPDGGPNFDPTPEHPFVWPWCRKGTNEMRITISHDGGLTWDRAASREAWIPHGTEQDSYDRLVIGCHPPLQIGQEDWFYCAVIDGDHLGVRNNADQSAYYYDRLPRHQVGLYIQKHNRYVSLQARTQPEILITQPVTVDGEELQLNVDASRGRVQVAIAAADPVATFNGTTPSTAAHLYVAQPLAGFGFDDGQPVYANSVEHTVRFTQDAALTSLQGRSVRLLFRVVDANLYGFRFAG